MKWLFERTDRNHNASHWLQRWYRRFLAFYPATYRACFADEMVTVFAEALTDAMGVGWQAVALLCWREARDLPRALYDAYRSSAQSWLARQLGDDGAASDLPGIVPVGQGSLPHLCYLVAGRSPWLRRSFDLCLAFVGLFIVLPLLVLLPLLIKLDSSGPIFYRQTRIGRGGQPYIMYKFRSMVAPAPAATLQLTRVGRWVRRWHWDEIPQLFNVLRGDMSIFGPRPPLSSK